MKLSPAKHHCTEPPTCQRAWFKRRFRPPGPVAGIRRSSSSRRQTCSPILPRRRRRMPILGLRRRAAQSRGRRVPARARRARSPSPSSPIRAKTRASGTSQRFPLSTSTTPRRDTCLDPSLGRASRSKEPWNWTPHCARCGDLGRGARGKGGGGHQCRHRLGQRFFPTCAYVTHHLLPYHRR